MLEETYRSMNETICPDSMLLEKTVRAADRTGGAKRPARPGRRAMRFLAAAAAVALCFCVTVPALAAGNSSAYGLLYAVSPAIAQYFKPVQLSCEDNGIRMEVASAYIHGDTAEIYVTMQDLVSDRVDGTTDLFDSYDINRPFDCGGTCNLSGYDADTRTATFLIQLTEWEDHRIEGEKITFSVREFLSKKTALEHARVDTDLSAAKEADASMRINLSGIAGSDLSDADALRAFEQNLRVLTPGEPLAEPIPGMQITGISYLDGTLRVQTATRDSLTLDTHASLWLETADGARIDADYSVSFHLYDTDEGQVDYETLMDKLDWNYRKLAEYPETSYNECLFQVRPELLADYALYGDFYTSGLNTKGNWSVTFPLENEG